MQVYRPTMKYSLVSGNNIYLNRKGADVFENFASIGRAVIKDLYSSRKKSGAVLWLQGKGMRREYAILNKRKSICLCKFEKHLGCRWLCRFERFVLYQREQPVNLLLRLGDLKDRTLAN
jgi:hypothetical protein